ncbi:MAG TPA: polysaccharide deacetylase family protein [Bacteroidales bacterium]|nr:polysaccharide deacetylase family protein [Bacteroidales bacterium]
MIRQVRLPFPARFFYPDAIYRISGSGRKLFLTFDDGPDAVSTPLLLDILRKKRVTATFFCTGKKVLDSPGLFAGIASEGHTIGNHGFSHLNGLTTPVREYCSDIFRGRDITCSNLFRPPYGRLRLRQYKILERSMRIVFWDVMPYDFDLKLTAESSQAILRRNVRPGSVVVLHDTATSHSLTFLEDFISFSLDGGYTFAALDDSFLHR